MKFQVGDWFILTPWMEEACLITDIFLYDEIVEYTYFCLGCECRHTETMSVSELQQGYTDLRDVPLLNLLLQIDFEQLKPALPFLWSKRA